jgi:homoserine kinase type II
LAVYTRVSDSALGAFLDGYDIGRPLALTPIAQGIENSNYHLHTERGRFILTLFEKRVRAADLPFFLALMNHLAARGLPCPVPVRGRDGTALRQLCGRPAAIVTLLPGTAVAEPDAAHTFAAGRLLADLHLAGAGFDRSRPNDLGCAGWRPLLSACAGRADEIVPGLAGELTRTLHEVEANWPQGLPEGIIHADLFPDNVLYTDGQVTGVIDFYFACRDGFAFDLAICLNAWCFVGGRFDPARAQELFAGYQSRRALTPAECTAFPVLARGAAMRFLLTRIYDLLHPAPDALVRPKDPLSYLARLRCNGASGADELFRDLLENSRTDAQG